VLDTSAVWKAYETRDSVDDGVVDPEQPRAVDWTNGVAGHLELGIAGDGGVESVGHGDLQRLVEQDGRIGVKKVIDRVESGELSVVLEFREDEDVQRIRNFVVGGHDPVVCVVE
jgi:hypothetical protein